MFIAFTGVKQAGKTTSFEIIKDIYPEAIEITLAAKLKDVCSQVFEIPRKYFDDQNIKEKELLQPAYLSRENIEAVIRGFGYTPDFEKHVRAHIGLILHTPRQIAQYIGTEVLRVIDNDIHCIGATQGLPEEGIFVVTDMRFPNEFAYFQTTQTEFFKPFYISNRQAESALNSNSHSSETSVLEIAKKCTTIDNNGSLADFRKNVTEAISALLMESAG
jgi:hypothetical protein